MARAYITVRPRFEYSDYPRVQRLSGDSAQAAGSATRTALGQPLRRGDDLCELDRVNELPEARQLAVADLPDVDCRLIQGLSVALPVPV
jgi:hypothetical protein